MTNEELFADLKQFIEVKFSQELANVATKDELATIKTEISDIRDEMATKADLVHLATKDDLAAIDDKLDEIFKTVGGRVVHLDDAVADHERRIARLEHRAA